MAIYLTLDGIDGPIKTPADGIDKAIELSSLQFGVSGSLSYEQDKGYKKNQEPRINELVVTKISDKATSDLFHQVLSSSFFNTGEVTVTRLIGGAAEAFFKLSMEEVFVSSWSVTSGGDLPVESLSMAFNKIRLSVNPEEDGKLQGWLERGWDLKKSALW